MSTNNKAILEFEFLNQSDINILTSDKSLMEFVFIGNNNGFSNITEWLSCDNSLSTCDNSKGTCDQTLIIYNQIN